MRLSGRARSYYLLAAVFLLALAVRGLYLWQISEAPFFDLRLGDGNAYHTWARNIADGDWLGEGVFYQAPLYPYFLAAVYKLFNDSAVTVRIVQALTGSASCVLLASAGIALFGPSGVIAGVLLALYPPAIFLESVIEKTALITLLTSALLALLVFSRKAANWRNLAGAGAVLGLLALVRENALLLVVPAVLWVAFETASGPLGQRLPNVLRFTAGCALILIPTGIRNLVVGGEFHLTTSQFGPNFYIGNHAGADGTYQPLVEGHGNVTFERDDATQLAQQAMGRDLAPSEVSHFWAKQALHYIVSNPGDWLLLTARKLAITLNAAERIDTESQYVYGEWSWMLRLLRPFDFGVVLTLAALGIVFTREHWRHFWLLYAIAAVYTVSTALFYVFARYRFPVVPVLMLLAAAGLVHGRDLWKARGGTRKRLTVAAMVGAATLVVSHLRVVDTSIDRAVNYLAIASGLARYPDRHAEAVEFYNRTIAEDPQWPPARYGLGILLTQMGRAQEAIPHLQTALAAWPNYAEAHYALSIAMMAAGRPVEAMHEYDEATRLGFHPQ